MASAKDICDKVVRLAPQEHRDMLRSLARPYRQNGIPVILSKAKDL